MTDLTGQFLASRGNANISPAQRRRASQEPALPASPVAKDDKGIIDTVGAVASDVASGVIETPRQVLGGVRDAAQETIELAGSLGEWLDENVVDLGQLSDIGVGEEGEALELPTVDAPRSTTGGLVRGMAQFLTGFAGGSKALKGISATTKGGKVAKAAAAGAIADATVFDPHEDRLSNLVEEFPALENPVTEFLSASSDDSEAEGRFKNALEGLGLGAITEGAMMAFKGMRSGRIAKAKDAQLKIDREAAEKLASVEVEEKPFVQSPEEVKGISEESMPLVEELLDNEASITSKGTVRVFHRTTKEAAEEISKTGKILGQEDGVFFSTKLDGEAAGFGDSVVELDIPVDNLRLDDVFGDEAHLKIPTKAAGDSVDVSLFIKKAEVKTSKPEFTPFDDVANKTADDIDLGVKVEAGAAKADPERAKNINLNRIETTDEVDSLINAVAETEAPKINEARREVITLEETEKLANDLGMTAKELLDRRKGQAFNAEQAVAARKILISSGESLINLAKTAATGSDQDVALFRRAMAQHSAIQSQVSGLTAEAGRALGSFRIIAKSQAAQDRAIKEALMAGGGTEVSKDMAAKLAQLDDPSQINAFIKGAENATTTDMVFEAWINGLLSSPATHVVNVLSNSLVAAWSVGERKVASLIGDAMGGQSIPEGEAAAQLKGMMEGTKDGMRLAWKAIKTGESSDPLQKIEQFKFKSITSENLGLSGMPGQFADFMGEVIRLPGRFLMAGDEMFKTVGYRMELNAQAFRQASNEGLKGEEMATRMADLILNPPENLHIAAIDVGRYQTFTKELGEAGKAAQDVRNKVPGARVIMPFIRTPVNIMKYVGERTPLAPMSKVVRAEINAGGARRDLAMAKIATGSLVMAAAADFALSGDITGAGPTNPAMRNTLRLTGWQPYSIKVGDDYFSYQRLDPIGAFIGLSADIAEISGQTGEFDALDLTTAAVIATAQNVTSKTYLSGVSEFFDVMSSASSDPDQNNRKAQRWLQRLSGSVIPSGVAALERSMSPELSATYGIIDKIKSRLPGYSDDLPPRRNIFGEPIVLQGGLGPDIMSPIYTSTDKKDKVADEIVSQQALIRMPRNSIDGVELDAAQYDRYIILYSGKENRRTKEVPLKTKLSELFRTPTYINATEGQEGGKSLMIRATFDAYRATAKAQMKEEFPALMNDIVISKQKKIKALTGR